MQSYSRFIIKIYNHKYYFWAEKICLFAEIAPCTIYPLYGKVIFCVRRPTMAILHKPNLKLRKVLLTVQWYHQHNLIHVATLPTVVEFFFIMLC